MVVCTLFVLVTVKRKSRSLTDHRSTAVMLIRWGTRTDCICGGWKSPNTAAQKIRFNILLRQSEPRVSVTYLEGGLRRTQTTSCCVISCCAWRPVTGVLVWRGCQLTTILEEKREKKKCWTPSLMINIEITLTIN